MNLSNHISVFNVIDRLKETFKDHLVDDSGIQMMGINDHTFLHYSADMPYRNAYQAYLNIKHFACFMYPGSRTGTISSRQFVQGVNISSVRRPSRTVFVFDYEYNSEDACLFMYERETGQLERVSHVHAEDRLSRLLFHFGT